MKETYKEKKEKKVVIFRVCRRGCEVPAISNLLRTVHKLLGRQKSIFLLHEEREGSEVSQLRLHLQFS